MNITELAEFSKDKNALFSCTKKLNAGNLDRLLLGALQMGDDDAINAIGYIFSKRVGNSPAPRRFGDGKIDSYSQNSFYSGALKSGGIQKGLDILSKNTRRELLADVILWLVSEPTHVFHKVTPEESQRRDRFFRSLSGKDLALAFLDNLGLYQNDKSAGVLKKMKALDQKFSETADHDAYDFLLGVLEGRNISLKNTPYLFARYQKKVLNDAVQQNAAAARTFSRKM